jgi:hypothetical protein
MSTNLDIFPLYEETMACPYSGMVICKHPEKNLHIRKLLLEAAEGNEAVQKDIWDLCAKSIFFWINYFAFTFKVRTTYTDGSTTASKNADVPFITWPVQDNAITELLRCIEDGLDALMDKSREMGATWILVAIVVWYYLFVENAQILVASATEDEVDETGNPDTIFWKIDYILKNLPDWMLPCERRLLQPGKKNRKHLLCINPETGAVITGAAQTEHIGKGARKRFGMFDEMAIMQHGHEAWMAAADTCSCRIANSTPHGAGTEFSNLRAQGVKHGAPTVIPLLYHNHPEKGLNRKMDVDRDGKITGVTGRHFWRTSWLDFELYKKQRIHNQEDVGQNIFADHTTSGKMFFDSPVISQHESKHAVDPVRCELTDDGKWFVPTEHGRWFVYVTMTEAPRRPGWWKIDRRTDYVSFADLSEGVGASNSVVAYMDRNKGDIVAEFCDPSTPLPQLADEVVLANKGIFRGGRGPCYLGWESNGPGSAWYLDVVKRLRFRRVYQRRRLGGKLNTRTREYGWHSGRKEKRILLTGLKSGLSNETITIYSRPCLMEMLEYIHYDDGSIGPGEHRDLATEARSAHGDRVIAVAGCVFMREEVGKFEAAKKKYPDGSWGDVIGGFEVLDD